VEVNGESCDESLAEIRRGLFSSAVSRIRRKATNKPVSTQEVDVAIAESRKERGLVLKAVIDTNVLVSGIINMQNAPGCIVDLIRTRVLQLAVDDRILAEYQSVLLSKRLRKWVAKKTRANLLAFLFLDASRIVPTIIVQRLPDVGDVPFIEVAITANVPLVTGNLKHFPEHLCHGHKIMSPTEFVCSL